MEYIKVTVTFERRSDGGLRAYSDDVPGFLLSGPDAEAVFSDVIPALEQLYEHNLGETVRFGPVGDIRESLRDEGFLHASEREKREYVAPRIAA